MMANNTPPITDQTIGKLFPSTSMVKTSGRGFATGFRSWDGFGSVVG